MNTRKSIVSALAVTLAVGFVPMAADAIAPGDRAPDTKVADADDHWLSMSDLRGSPVVVFYEDKDSRDVNAALKGDVAHLMAEDGMGAIRVIPVADVSEYDSWPSRGFVKKAVREESKKAGLTIYCDWDASFRRTYALEKGQSNVVIVGRDGVVKAAMSGPLSASARADVVALLRAEAKKD